MPDYIKYKSPNSVTTKKREESEQLQEDIINFIAEGGLIDVYDSCNRHISSHINV